MVRHIVFWQLEEEAEGKNKWENAAIMKERLEGLIGVIPELLEAEVGLNKNGGEYDACLVSKFESMEALKAYDAHPEHQKIRDFIGKVRVSRVAIDYEI